MERTTKCSSVFCLRVNKKIEEMMEHLADANGFQGNKSALIKNMIKAEYVKLLNDARV